MGGVASSMKKKPRECKCDDFECHAYSPGGSGYKLVGKGITGTASERKKLCDAKNRGQMGTRQVVGIAQKKDKNGRF